MRPRQGSDRTQEKKGGPAQTFPASGRAKWALLGYTLPVPRHFTTLRHEALDSTHRYPTFVHPPCLDMEIPFYKGDN